LVAEQVKTVPAVSVDTVVVVQPVLDVMLEPGEGSLTAQLTVTGVVFQPAVFGAGLTVGVTTGGVLSILMPLAEAVVLTLPATSVHVPVADNPAPSVLSVTGEVQVAIPDKASVPVKDTTTLVLFQPAALGAGVAAATAVGRVMSILMVAATEFVSPAEFTAVQVNVVPGVSAVRVTGSQPVETSELIPEMGSVTVQLNVTLELFHPAELGAGEITGTTTGAVVSIRTCTLAEPVAPLLSVAVHMKVVPLVSVETVVVPQPVLEAIPVG
jgi:hypothetical protein